MKKYCIWFLVVVCTCFLCSCSMKADSLDSELELKIKEDYVAMMADHGNTISVGDVYVQEYLGTYKNGAVALFISANESFLQVMVNEEIAGILFTFPTSQPLYIYYDSDFIPLKKAFENQTVIKNDVEAIYRAYTEGNK